MYCPQCGQQQISEIVRFCPRCGLPFDGVIQLLANGGVLPVYQGVEGTKEISPRRKGVRQGGVLLLSGVLLVPILGVLSHFARNSDFLDLLVAIAALLCFVGGPLRMIYAALFEEGTPYRQPAAPPLFIQPSVPPQSGVRGGRVAALHSAPANPASGWRPRPATAELVQPPSITENTTRLLDKDEPTDP